MVVALLAVSRQVGMLTPPIIGPNSSLAFVRIVQGNGYLPDFNRLQDSSKQFWKEADQ